MMFIISRQDGIVEIREQVSIPQGAITINDTLLSTIKQAISMGKVLSIVNGSITFLDPSPPSASELAAEAKIAQDISDAQAAKQYIKLQTLAAMTPAQVLTWVQGNVTNLASAQDAIATLAVAISVLARRI